jgi:ubiquinone/menaquinone biosynthesis C-methylase UbiE
MLYHKVFFKLYKSAANKKCLELKDFIKKNSKIIDIGCGSGILANELSRSFDAEVTGVDIIDVRAYKIPFKLIDGKELPFEDNSFDNALIAYVLHHAQDPIHVLEEAKRVAKNKIFVYEDIPEGLVTKIFTKIHAFLFDLLYGPDSRTSFKVGHEWKKVFNEVGLKVVVEKRVTPLVNQRLFVLTKSQGA